MSHLSDDVFRLPTRDTDLSVPVREKPAYLYGMDTVLQDAGIFQNVIQQYVREQLERERQFENTVLFMLTGVHL
jgi:hypothetical protein